MYDFGIRQTNTGYRVGYRPDETNYCPGCGNSHWMIGRMSAECAFCATALPLIAGGSTGISALRQSSRPIPMAA